MILQPITRLGMGRMTAVGQGPRIDSADGVSGSHLIAAYWYAARLTQGARSRRPGLSQLAGRVPFCIASAMNWRMSPGDGVMVVKTDIRLSH
jgi:hypothetical protein